MQTQKGEEGFDRVDGHCGRGGAAMVILETDDGELLALRQGPRTMPLIYSHLIPATLDGRARMNVANALAAAAAAWAAGAHLHDIRQGLRTFSTSFFQAPGPPQRGRRARLQGGHRLLPQRRRHAPPDRVRGPDHDRRRSTRTPRVASGKAASNGERHGPRHRRHRHPR